jgi:hypothetical protein
MGEATMTIKQLLRYVGAALFGIVFVSWAVPSLGVQMIVPIIFLVLLLAMAVNPSNDIVVFLIAIAAGVVAF